jgi:stress-induced morphogen
LEITDESHHHVGHAGAEDGKYHLRLKIASQALDNKSLISAHREIYSALEGLMQTRIHALKIQVIR